MEKMIQLYRSLQGATDSVRGVLEIARCTHPNPAVYPLKAMDILVSDPESVRLLYQDIATAEEGIAWLKGEVAARQAPAVTK
jgi:hypothetical protein